MRTNPLVLYCQKRIKVVYNPKIGEFGMSGQQDGLAGVIARLKQDGVAAAEQQKQEIVAGAQEAAAQLLSKAQSDIMALKSEAEEQIKAAKKEFAVELKMAARDFLMQFECSFREQLVLPEMKTGIESALKDAACLSQCFESAVTNFAKSQGQVPVLLMSNGLGDVLSPAMLARLQEKYSNGSKLEVRVSDELEAFQLVSKNGQMSWDFSIDTLAAALSKLVQPKFSLGLKTAATEVSIRPTA